MPATTEVPREEMISGRQARYLARLLCQAAEIGYPETKTDARRVIGELKRQIEEAKTDDCPL